MDDDLELNFLDVFWLCGLGCWRFLVFFGVFDMGCCGSSVVGWRGLMMFNGFGMGMGKRGFIVLLLMLIGGGKNFLEVLGFLMLWRMMLFVNNIRGIILFSFFDRRGLFMLRGSE